VTRREWRVTAFGEPRDALAFERGEVPEPGPGEVRVTVAANSLNFLDASMCRGEYPVRPDLPFVAGAELVGVVSAVGAGVTAPVFGDRVVAMSPLARGCFCEEAIVAAHTSFGVPPAIPDEHAAALLVTYQTAYVALHRRARLREGEVVLVHAGAGGLGSALIQLARAHGATVLATAGSEEKVRICLEQGATAAVDYRNASFREMVDDATDGRGADVVCDQVGGDVFVRSLECVAFEGRVLPLGWAGGTMPAFEAGDVVARNLDVLGVSWGSTYPHVAGEVVRDVHAELLRLYEQGHIRPLIGELCEATQLPAALQRLANGELVGKAIVRWRTERTPVRGR
jgi:NADPH:quinone reductase